METKILFNDYRRGMKVANHIKTLLSECDTFDLSIAFINHSGLQVLKQCLAEAKERGVKGRIITSTYLSFNAPKDFRELLKLYDNIDVRIYPIDDKEGFHPKGYIFKCNDERKVIIGSSNLTQKALLVNQEWNMYLSSNQDDETIQQICEEYEIQWNKSFPLTNEWIDQYEKEIEDIKTGYEVVITPRNPSTKVEIEPNKMQKEALQSLAKLRQEDKDKALLISATGTGKTYLAAFDVRAVKPKKLLFVVHRRSIALKAKESFQQMMPYISMGMFSGELRDLDCDYLFATVQTVAKEENLKLFSPDYFDYIIFDEVHKAGAESYQRLFQYYTPKFLLGMSATPERNDGFDIYKMFDYNIAYEIRLQEALEYDLLCPFHYYGITDLTVDNADYDAEMFTSTEKQQRYDYITSKIEYYGYSGTKIHGLIFVSRISEALQVQEEMNKRGYKTLALVGDSTEEQRQAAMDSLESNDEDSLDYIVTVDIFNEGIDIPIVNQVVMLRPTESAIIFIQQLGRGLRKNKDKEYVVILDFIGNYEKNFLIPIALSGDRSYNKDGLRHFIQEDSRTIPGCSTIEFDEISRKRIYEAIDAANFSTLKLIKESYNNLKMKLGKIPTLWDFDKYGEIDVLRIVDNQGSYHKFLTKYDKDDYTVKLNELQEKFIEYISVKFLIGKRPNDLIVVRELIEHPENNDVITTVKDILWNEYQIEINENGVINLTNNLNNKFYSGSSANAYKKCIFMVEENNKWHISHEFKECLEDDNFKKIMNDLVQYGLYRNNRDYPNRYKDTTLQLYSKYSYEDVCRLLEWHKAEVALNIGGYKFDKDTKTYPVFINYEKSEDISDTTKYEDHFVSRNELIAISKSKRTITSDDVQNAVHADQRGIHMELFVRKNKDDKVSKEFYYLGRMYATGELKEFIMPGTTSTAVEITYKLEDPVPENLYDYITK